MNSWWVWAVIGASAAVALIFILYLLFVRHGFRGVYVKASKNVQIGGESSGIIKRKKKKKKRGRSNNASTLAKETDLWRAIRSNLNDHSISNAIRDTIRTGLLMANVPIKMVQGKEERVEVRIARSSEFRQELVSELQGPGEPEVEEIDTSFYMEVKLIGQAFEVVSHSPSEQLILPTPARWEFDVLPFRAGQQKITIYVTMRIEVEGIAGGRRGVSSLEKQIQVQVSIGYAARSFVAGNWQWLIPTVLTVAGTVAAWLVVPF